MTWWNLQILVQWASFPGSRGSSLWKCYLPGNQRGPNPTELNATETEVAKSASGSLSMAVSSRGSTPGLLGLCRCSWMRVAPQVLRPCPRAGTLPKSLRSRSVFPLDWLLTANTECYRSGGPQGSSTLLHCGAAIHGAAKRETRLSD